MKETTQMLTWETHNDGKNHESPQTAEIHYESKVTTMRCKEATTSCSSSSPHAAVTIEATSSLSLTLFHAVSVHTRYTTNFTNVSTTTSKMLALSHIYTYMTFGLFTHVSLPIVGRIGTGSSVIRFSLTSIRRDLFPIRC